jgi:hypothetical protein
MLAADYVFAAAVVFVIGCNLYFGPRIPRQRVVMQWGFDGKPTWLAPKWLALWGMVGFMLAVRVLIWLAMTYKARHVHAADVGIVGLALIAAGSHFFVLRTATEDQGR